MVEVDHVEPEKTPLSSFRYQQMETPTVGLCFRSEVNWGLADDCGVYFGGGR
jgi:hypothetical protein